MRTEMAQDQSGELRGDSGKMGSVKIWVSWLLMCWDAQFSARWEPGCSWLAVHRV